MSINAVHVTAARLRICLNRTAAVGRQPVTAGVELNRCAVARCGVTLCDLPHLLGSLPHPGASQLTYK